MVISEEKMAAADEELAAKLREQEVEESGQGIECACCFGDYSFVRMLHSAACTLLTRTSQESMIQCPDTHLFCKSCAQRSA